MSVHRYRAFRLLTCWLTGDTVQNIDDATRTAISRVGNIIRVLASHSVPLTDVVLLEAYEWAVEQDLEVKDLLQLEIGEALVATLTGR